MTPAQSGHWLKLVHVSIAQRLVWVWTSSDLHHWLDDLGERVDLDVPEAVKRVTHPLLTN